MKTLQRRGTAGLAALLLAGAISALSPAAEVPDSTTPPPAEGDPSAGGPQRLALAEQRVHAALNRGRQARGQAAQEAAARELLAVYAELTDRRDLGVENQNRLLVMVAGRLARLGDDLVLHLRRLERRGPSRSVAELPASPVTAAVPEGAPAGPPAQDHGPALVELIRDTVFPPAWQENGGVSVIRYYAPQHVLVITAPSEVHTGIGDLLRQFRR